MNPTTRKRLLIALDEMSERYPDWRLGQMFANIVDWAKQPGCPEESAAALWEIEDQEIVKEIERHLEQLHQTLHPAESS